MSVCVIVSLFVLSVCVTVRLCDFQSFCLVSLCDCQDVWLSVCVTVSLCYYKSVTVRVCNFIAVLCWMVNSSSLYKRSEFLATQNFWVSSELWVFHDLVSPMVFSLNFSLNILVWRITPLFLSFAKSNWRIFIYLGLPPWFGVFRAGINNEVVWLRICLEVFCKIIFKSVR